MKSRNILIAEAFLRFFIVILGDYKTFIKTSPANNASKQESELEEQNFVFDVSKIFYWNIVVIY